MVYCVLSELIAHSTGHKLKLDVSPSSSFR